MTSPTPFPWEQYYLVREVRDRAYLATQLFPAPARILGVYLTSERAHMVASRHHYAARVRVVTGPVALLADARPGAALSPSRL